jgi:hypothetical protein
MRAIYVVGEIETNLPEIAFAGSLEGFEVCES